MRQLTHLYNQTLSEWQEEQKQGTSTSSAVRTVTIWMNFEYQLRF